MRPTQILQALCLDASRERAAGELLALLRKRAGVRLARLRNGAADDEDVVATVAERLIMNPRPDLADGSDGAVVAYLDTMLRNTAVDMWRDGRARLEPSGEQRLVELAGGADTADLRELAEPLSALQSVFEHVRDGRAPRYRAGLEVTWRQLQDLLLGVRDMDDLLLQDEHAGPDPLDRRRARDRILQNHHRLRTALGDGIEELRRARWLAPDRAAAARDALRWLFRCHHGTAGGVQGEGSTS